MPPKTLVPSGPADPDPHPHLDRRASQCPLPGAEVQYRPDKQAPGGLGQMYLAHKAHGRSAARRTAESGRVALAPTARPHPRRAGASGLF